MSYIIVGQQTKPRPFRKACLRAAGWIVCSFAAFGSATLILTIIVLRRRIWRTPLFHLLFKAWQSLVSSISTNTLGFVMEIALSVIVFVTTLFVVLLRTEKGERSRALRTSLIAAAATAVVTLCFWSAMFGWNVIKTVYDDHQKEQSEARTLTAKNNSLASDNKGLGNVETAKSAAPRISKPTKLGDVVSIHQTGGITAGTVNIDQPPPPHVEWTQERLPSGVGIKETGPTTWIGPPLGSIDRKNPGAKIRLAVDHSWPNAFFPRGSLQNRP